LDSHISDDIAQSPSTEMLHYNIKKLQE